MNQSSDMVAPTITFPIAPPDTWLNVSMSKVYTPLREYASPILLALWVGSRKILGRNHRYSGPRSCLRCRSSIYRLPHPRIDPPHDGLYPGWRARSLVCAY